MTHRLVWEYVAAYTDCAQRYLRSTEKKMSAAIIVSLLKAVLIITYIHSYTHKVQTLCFKGLHFLRSMTISE